MKHPKTIARRARRDYLRKISRVRATRAALILARKSGRSRDTIRKRKLAYDRAKADRAKAKRVYRRWRKIAALPLRERALHYAVAQLGVLEEGGNNRGPVVSQIIRMMGGEIGEAWCGDAVGSWYMRAGSKSVTRAWAAAHAGLWGWLSGVSRVKHLREMKPGHIVEYDWQHTGLFEKWIDRSAGTFYAIEGNTGSGGNTSDTTADGIRRRERNINDVGGAFAVHR